MNSLFIDLSSLDPMHPMKGKQRYMTIRLSILKTKIRTRMESYIVLGIFIGLASFNPPNNPQRDNIHFQFLPLDVMASNPEFQSRSQSLRSKPHCVPKAISYLGSQCGDKKGK